jgi:3-hydroxymyristoyl/3-hydroxydecanoyl-(acyl carrier protein) dehydratase
MSAGGLRARLDVPAAHPMFAGHFPDMPVAPGAWLLARSMEVLEDSAGVRLAWGELESAKFHRTVAPGVTLDVLLDGEFQILEPSTHMTKVDRVGATGGVHLTIRDGDVAVATARFRRVDRSPIDD